MLLYLECRIEPTRCYCSLKDISHFIEALKFKKCVESHPFSVSSNF